jgi:hypothetical protein
MESYWEDITPARAAEYLKGNAAGRSLNQSAVDMYARDMAAGRWRLTHQGIALDQNGVMIDGQHRMAAIVRSGVIVKFWVTRDVEQDAFGSIDTGRGRSMADRFHIAGHSKHATQLAAVCRKATLWQAGYPWSRKYHPTRDEIAKTLEDHPNLANAAQYAHAWPGRRTLAPALAGFCWWLFSSIDQDDAVYFMDALRSGESLEKGDPILALRERLLSDRGTATASRASYAVGFQRQEVHLALTIIAWNHYRKRNRISKMQLPSTMNDETFPQPI